MRNYTVAALTTIQYNYIISYAEVSVMAFSNIAPQPGDVIKPGAGS